jgi:hypothetical protein
MMGFIINFIASLFGASIARIEAPEIEDVHVEIKQGDLDITGVCFGSVCRPEQLDYCEPIDDL